MAITRSQIARQLMQEGGVPKDKGIFLVNFRKIKDDIIPNELINNQVELSCSLCCS